MPLRSDTVRLLLRWEASARTARRAADNLTAADLPTDETGAFTLCPGVRFQEPKGMLLNLRRDLAQPSGSLRHQEGRARLALILRALRS